MNIFVTGVSHKNTPLEIREKISFSVSEQKSVLQKIKNLEDVDQSVILSTCNRTEVYVYSNRADFDSGLIEKLLCEVKGLCISEMRKYFYTYRGVKSVRHLYEVASGLDSLVLGEDQILGQVKGAYDLALDTCTSSGVLNTLFRDAITAAKKVKTETEISRNSVSVGSVAVKLISGFFEGRLQDKCALIIGTGKIGTIALKHLGDAGINKIYVTNRSHGKAVDLSRSYDYVNTVDYLERYSVMDRCDIVISSTSSPHYTITRDMLENSITTKRQRIFVDLAVPRDIDEDIRELQGIKYFNIDHLKAEVDGNIDKRMSEVSRAKEIIDRYVNEYTRWYEFRGVLPIVKDVQKYTEDILNEKISQTLSRLKCASDEDKEIVKASIVTTVNSILNKFVYNIRECENKDDVEAYFRCLKEVIKND
mgnify:CR=1 FL=1